MASVVPDRALADFADIVLRVGRELDPHGPHALDIIPLTGTEALVMRWVHRNPGTSPSEVAQATALQRSNCSVALRSLVAKGMVERRTEPLDGRAVHLHATPVAERSIARLHAHWAERLRAALGGDERDVLVAARVLARIDENLRGPASS
ncbi:MAG: MarR family transcriptional regulator [Microbacterium enclense]